MRTGVTIDLNASDRQQLAAVVADRNSPQKHVWRAQIVLLTADGCGTAEVMRLTNTAKTTVWRWQERFMTEGVAGLLRDKTRPPRIPPLGKAVEQAVVARTLSDPPGETTHWTADAVAKQSGISVSAVQRIWRKHGLLPHRTHQFKLSNDPRFADNRGGCGGCRSPTLICLTASGGMSVEIIIDNFLGRQVVWTIAAEAVQRLRPKTMY